MRADAYSRFNTFRPSVMFVFLLRKEQDQCSIMFLLTKITVGGGTWYAQAVLTFVSHGMLDPFLFYCAVGE